MTTRIYVSHEKEDRGALRAFMMLPSTMHFDFRFLDRSLVDPEKEKDPEYVRRLIRDRLHATDATVVLIGASTRESEWVGYEIQESIKRGNALLGIRAEGQGGAGLPPALEEAKAKVIDWAPHEFKAAVEEALKQAGR
ncbi:MAG: TIR domain-containing protein [Deltaproteobacteria bacterium]|nr:TIR domain-containing protein [Deltaproteobacteria bacterium]